MPNRYLTKLETVVKSYTYQQGYTDMKIFTLLSLLTLLIVACGIGIWSAAIGDLLGVVIATVTFLPTAVAALALSHEI